MLDNLFWRRLFRLPQTYFLIVGVGLSYISFILWLGIRPVVLLIGGAISILMLASWVWKLRQIQSLAKANLLDQDIFLAQLTKLQRKLAGHSYSDWEQVLYWGRETQVFAVRIASREPELTPELIETLYTVLALSDQVAEAVIAREEIETEIYRNLTEQHLQKSYNRVQETYNQLQQLQDQIVLSSLETSGVKAGLPRRLRLLIADNKTALQLRKGG